MAQDDQPQYNQAFYDAIITARRQAGNVGYVDIDECMETMGRAYSQSVFQNETVENERA